MMACLLCRIGIHADVRYGAVSARWQGLGTWRAGLIKLSHDYCNLIGSHNIPRLHTESRLQSPDVLSFLERLARETSVRVGASHHAKFTSVQCWAVAQFSVLWGGLCGMSLISSANTVRTAVRYLRSTYIQLEKR